MNIFTKEEYEFFCKLLDQAPYGLVQGHEDLVGDLERKIRIYNQADL